MSNKIERIKRREIVLEGLIDQGQAYCMRHERPITKFDVTENACYNGDHGSRWCQHFRRLGRYPLEPSR
ncbi:MAG: hypothetical protein NTX24_03535 [Candidatus Pacearchaeota archaeon]|nr:hypothetical protein [Candidatus Pacearchaeota archaeon]